MSGTLYKRIAAIDVFRAITMFLMIFVNDIPGVKEIPHWLMHAAADEDMLGFSDLIFPAFLFCMGMSVPFAIEKRFSKGDSVLAVIKHILYRTFALVLMGLCTLNSGGVAGGLSHQVIILLMVLSFFLCFAVYPDLSGKGKYFIYGAKLLGFAIIAFIIVYKDLNGKSFKVSWWGILALIGWTYAVCSLVYLFLRNNIKKVAIAFGVIVLLSILNHLPFIPAQFSCRWLFLSFVPMDWTLHAFGFAGVLTTILMLKYANLQKPVKFVSIMFNMGVGALLLGIMTHSFWIINKIQATPSWLFYCLAIFFPFVSLIWWVTDVLNGSKYFKAIKPAGDATLTCYMLPYIWYAIIQMLGFSYPAPLRTGLLGLCVSLLFAFVIVQLTGLLVKGKIKLKI